MERKSGARLKCGNWAVVSESLRAGCISPEHSVVGHQRKARYKVARMNRYMKCARGIRMSCANLVESITLTCLIS